MQPCLAGYSPIPEDQIDKQAVNPPKAKLTN